MSTGPLECGLCGRDHSSAEPCTFVWQVDGGNSTTGAVGFVLHGIRADSKEQALEQAKDRLPEAVEIGGGLMVYINADALTVEDVYEDAWDD